MKKKVFSGIQPSGNLHIGNYLGAIQNWVKSQDEFDNIFCVVDLHAITVPQKPEALKNNIRETAGLLLAAGIDPNKSALFVQSHIPAHSELTWLLNCFTPMGWLGRMTQFKEKSENNKEKAGVGLYDYPVLMAADILLYNTQVVPVGEDQRQHVELARDIAKRFNSLFGDTFVIPEAVVPASGARIMSLDKPEHKMSKSADNPSGTIDLLETEEAIRKKIMSATTDSETDIVFDQNRAGLYNLLTIYQSFSGLEQKDIEDKFKGKGYGDFKKDLVDVVMKGLKPLQDKYKELTAEPDKIDNILKQSADKIRGEAEKMLEKVRNKIGLS